MSRWWRAYDEALNDPKLQKLGLKMVGAWFNLLCVASQNGGQIEDKTIAFCLRSSKKRSTEIVQKLVDAGLLERTSEGNYTPHNWQQRQYVGDHSTERVRRFRKRKNEGNETVSHRFRTVSGTAPDTEADTDKKGRGNGTLPTDDWRARRDRKHEALAAFKKFVNTPFPDEGSGRS